MIASPEVEHHKLLDHHRANLHASGLTDETIREAGIYSETNHIKLATLLNRKKYYAKNGPAIVFPFHDANDAIVLHRVRPDYGKSRYLQPCETGVRVYIPRGVHRLLSSVDQPLIVTEGEKKSLSCWQSGHAAIGLTGVTCWHAKQSSSLLPDLERIAWNGRRVFIAFDSDKYDKPQVLENEQLLAAALRSRGASVRAINLYYQEVNHARIQPRHEARHIDANL